jgi:hypothetical protein
MNIAPSIREQVIAALVETYAQAKAQGLDGWRAVQTAFPGKPPEVIAEAMLAAEDEATAAWWASVERTIDAQIIGKAIVVAGGRQ